MLITPKEQAVAVLNNKQLPIRKRELALHYLTGHPTLEGIKAMVDALRDSDFALRWLAATALAQLGPLALPEVLRALTNPKSNTVRLREGVVHILHYSSNLAHESVFTQQHMEPQVFIEPGKLVSVRKLMTALKGQLADINSMKEAGKLLLEFENHPKNK